MKEKGKKIHYTICGPLKMTAEVDRKTAAVLKVIGDNHLDFITKYKVLDDTTVELEVEVTDAVELAKANKKVAD